MYVFYNVSVLLFHFNTVFKQWTKKTKRISFPGFCNNSTIIQTYCPSDVKCFFFKPLEKLQYTVILDNVIVY